LFYAAKKYFGRFGITIGCPNCQGRSKRYGKRNSRQRYRCLNYGHVFFRRRSPRLPVAFRDFKAFRQYAVKTVDQETLYVRLKFSRQTLSARFNLFLLLPPPPELVNAVVIPTCCSTTLWVYGFDGKWLGRSPILLIHRDVINKETLWWSVAFSESMAAVRSDLIGLIGSCPGLIPPAGAVSDGKPGIAAVIKNIFHLDYCQRCLVHVARDLKKYLPLHSPLAATQSLRLTALDLTEVNIWTEKQAYLTALDQWHRHYGGLLKERSYPVPGTGVKRRWWYTHGNLRRAWRLLTKDTESLFHFLDNPLVPKTNNSLEGVNRHLRRRNDMGKGKQLSLMMWRLAFSRIKTERQLTILWAYWKKSFKPN
jgi:hypothetical protein